MTTTYSINLNSTFNSLEISFNSYPADCIRSFLKENRFRWHHIKKCWYGYYDPETMKAVLNGMLGISPEKIAIKDFAINLNEPTTEKISLDNIHVITVPETVKPESQESTKTAGDETCINLDDYKVAFSICPDFSSDYHLSKGQEKALITLMKYKNRRSIYDADSSTGWAYIGNEYAMVKIHNAAISDETKKLLKDLASDFKYDALDKVYRQNITNTNKNYLDFITVLTKEVKVIKKDFIKIRETRYNTKLLKNVLNCFKGEFSMVQSFNNYPTIINAAHMQAIICPVRKYQ